MKQNLTTVRHQVALATMKAAQTGIPVSQVKSRMTVNMPKKEG